MKMTIEEILEIESEGLSQTITQYSNDYFVKSYARKLLSIQYPKDVRILTILVNYLVAWYDIKINEIEVSDFVVSKESHTKSFRILKKIKKMLNKQQGKEE